MRRLGPWSAASALPVDQGVVDDFGPLFTSRGLAVPVSGYTVGSVPHFVSVRDACRAAAEAERSNIGMYDRLLTSSLPTDVYRVFQNNRAASLTNHLSAFERCS